MFSRLDRLELKFIVSSAQCERLAALLGERLQGDPNLAGRSQYPVATLYFDSDDLRCYQERILESPNRRKLRVRIYGSIHDELPPAIFLEIKQNQNGRIGKRRMPISHAQWTQFGARLEPRHLFDAPSSSPGQPSHPVLREARQLIDTFAMHPVCLVHYDRMALQGCGADEDVRVTIDSNLRYQPDPAGFWSNDCASEEPLLEPDRHLLEVKTTGTLPCWLAKVLNEEKCRVQSFSKYCQAVERRPRKEMTAHA